jgi:hypothetical protein
MPGPTFSQDVTFDGGFTLPALCKPSVEDFQSAGLSRLGNHCKDIRNALAHSRDLKQMSSIAPTPANHVRLRPWATLMSAIAIEVMLFRES